MNPRMKTRRSADPLHTDSSTIIPDLENQVTGPYMVKGCDLNTDISGLYLVRYPSVTGPFYSPFCAWEKDVPPK